MSKYIINLDLHGGDFAPQSVLEGALIAQTKNSSIKFNLHSDRHIYEKFKSPFSKLFNYSTVYLRTIENITRPAIASFFPSEKHPVCFLDLGANAECNSENLLDFAVMGSTYYKVLYPQIDTKVALLNIGSEELKGNNLIQETHELMKSDKRINYQGFVEADEITSTNNHVIVTDGFSGNIALKTAEGVSKFITDSLKKSLTSTSFSKILSLLLKKNFKDFKNLIDPRNYNGGMFIGVNGIVIKSHGNADSHAFANAIEFGIKCIDNDLLNEIKKNVSR